MRKNKTVTTPTPRLVRHAGRVLDAETVPEELCHTFTGATLDAANAEARTELGDDCVLLRAQSHQRKAMLRGATPVVTFTATAITAEDFEELSSPDPENIPEPTVESPDPEQVARDARLAAFTESGAAEQATPSSAFPGGVRAFSTGPDPALVAQAAGIAGPAPIPGAARAPSVMSPSPPTHVAAASRATASPVPLADALASQGVPAHLLPEAASITAFIDMLPTIDLTGRPVLTVFLPWPETTAEDDENVVTNICIDGAAFLGRAGAEILPGTARTSAAQLNSVAAVAVSARDAALVTRLRNRATSEPVAVVLCASTVQHRPAEVWAAANALDADAIALDDPRSSARLGEYVGIPLPLIALGDVPTSPALLAAELIERARRA